MAVNVKMGVDIGGFTAGIKQGQQILKGLNAEMKASEAEFKATGNAEQKLNAQTKTLNSQLNVQKGIADQARQALKAMTDQGVDPADAAYQKLYVQLLNAEAGANEAQAALNALGQGTSEAAEGAEKLGGSLQNISKKMSLDQVITGIDRITSGLENAAKKAIQLGEDLWNTVMDSARWADDTNTMAQMYGIDIQRFQQMQGLVKSGLDTTVEAQLAAQDKLKKGVGKSSKEVMDTLQELGLAFASGKSEVAQLITEDEMDLFFRAGQAIMNMTDAYDKEAAAQTLFGRSWKELIPLFSEYKSLEEYNKALDGVETVSNGAVDNLTMLYDTVGDLVYKFDVLKNEVMGALAPALTDAANALNGLLTSVLEYLKTDAGKQALEDLSKAVSGLFDDLGKIDPEKVVEGFTGVLNTVVESVQWLVNNKQSVVDALDFILKGWAVLKLTGTAATVLTLVNGLKDLGLIGGAAAASGAAGTSAGIATGMSAGIFGTLASPIVQNNAVPIADWFINYTDVGRSISGQQSWDETMHNFEQWQRDTEERFNNFFKDWAEIFGDTSVTGKKEAEVQVEPVIPPDIEKEINEKLKDKDIRLEADIFAWGNKNKTPGESFLDVPSDELMVELYPEVPEDADKIIGDQVGTVYIPVQLQVTGITAGAAMNGGGGLGGKVGAMDKWFNIPLHANGIWDVPYDGYLASLHKGERVMPAREVASSNFSSNLYVESMYMSSGTDAAGLASAMAAAQRRQMSGYGS